MTNLLSKAFKRVEAEGAGSNLHYSIGIYKKKM